MRLESLEFHIKSGDYFGTLATVLNLIQQTIKDNKKCFNALDDVVKDLVYLQEEYKIVKK